jgi:hypothetical protein
MANYLVRVELHGADYDDYEALHSAMERAGFSRKIRCDDGKEYNLPTAEYCIQGSYSATGVRDAAAKAASSVGKRFGVIAAESTALAWVGLSEVAQSAYR